MRAKGGQHLALQFQAATNAITQKVQQMVKQSAQRAGIEIELKVVTPTASFSSDAGNPDTFGRFQADMQMYNWTSFIPDPETLMPPVASWEKASKVNQEMGKNSVRWPNAEFDALFRAAQTKTTP